MDTHLHQSNMHMLHVTPKLNDRTNVLPLKIFLIKHREINLLNKIFQCYINKIHQINFNSKNHFINFMLFKDLNNMSHFIPNLHT